MDWVVWLDYKHCLTFDTYTSIFNVLIEYVFLLLVQTQTEKTKDSKVTKPVKKKRTKYKVNNLVEHTYLLYYCTNTCPENVKTRSSMKDTVWRWYDILYHMYWGDSVINMICDINHHLSKGSMSTRISVLSTFVWRIKVAFQYNSCFDWLASYSAAVSPSVKVLIWQLWWAIQSVLWLGLT